MTVFGSDIPEAVVEYVEGAIQMGDFRMDALDLAERYLGIDRQRMDRAIVRARWASRWARSQRSRTLSVVEQAVNEVLESDHIARLVTDRRFEELPEHLRHPHVHHGVLTIKDAKRTVGAIYLRSFLEVSPPEVVVRALHVAAEHRQKLGRATSYPFPLAWDVTAGSGTVRRVLEAVKGRVVASDLTPAFNDIMLDARGIGTAPHHLQPFVRRARSALDVTVRPGLDDTELSVDRPHIIYFDPPSRGWPIHQAEYGGGPPAPQQQGRDLGELSRGDWVVVVGGVTVLAFEYIAEGGVVALLTEKPPAEPVGSNAYA